MHARGGEQLKVAIKTDFGFFDSVVYIKKLKFRILPGDFKGIAGLHIFLSQGLRKDMNLTCNITGVCQFFSCLRQVLLIL